MKTIKKIFLSIVAGTIICVIGLFIAKLGLKNNDYLGILTNFVIGTFFFLAYLCYQELGKND